MKKTLVNLADACDGSFRSAVNVAMKHLGIDTGHQNHIGIAMCDVLARVAERFGTTELFESDKIRELAPQNTLRVAIRTCR